MSTPEHAISRKVEIEDSQRTRLTIMFNHEHGEAYTTFDPETGLLYINDIVTTKSRRGVGKALLNSVNNLAHEIEADRVMAFIVSRECLDSMQSVFGADALEVRSVGPYASDDNVDDDGAQTSAKLYFRPGADQ